MYRRRFSAFAYCFLIFAGCAYTPSRDIDISAVALTGLSILQGYTTETETQFSVVVPENKTFKYFIRSESDESEIEPREFEVERKRHGRSKWAVDRLFVSSLEPNRIFRLEVRDAADTLIDAREFKTLNSSGNSLRILAASCMNDKYHSVQTRIWPEALRREPDVIFLLGDNVYTVPEGVKHIQIKPGELWNRYLETRLRLELFKSPRLIPTLATWDDNDFGMPDGDLRYGYKKESAEIFRTFFAQEPDMRNLIAGPGVSYVWRARGQRFFFMDNRTFRSPNNLGGDDETHWGKGQERWLLEEIALGDAPTWIINGDQIFGGYHQFESFQGNHPEAFKRWMERMNEFSLPVVFLSGDRHNTEVMRIRNGKLKSFELTTSPIHAKTYPSPWKETPNPAQIVGKAGVPNYMIIESENLNGHMRLRLTSYTLADKILFNEVLWLSRDGRRLKVY